jgi:hypothetical protein
MSNVNTNYKKLNERDVNTSNVSSINSSSKSLGSSLYTQRFSSNLCTVLNDPRKDRNKINCLFTKTWGTDFVDSVSVQPLNNIKNYKTNDFQDYLIDIKDVNLLTEQKIF